MIDRRRAFDTAILTAETTTAADLAARMMIATHQLRRPDVSHASGLSLAATMLRSSDPDIRHTARVVAAACDIIEAALPIVAAVAGTNVGHDFAAWAYLPNLPLDSLRPVPEALR